MHLFIFLQRFEPQFLNTKFYAVALSVYGFLSHTTTPPETEKPESRSTQSAGSWPRTRTPRIRALTALLAKRKPPGRSNEQVLTPRVQRKTKSPLFRSGTADPSLQPPPATRSPPGYVADVAGADASRLPQGCPWGPRREAWSGRP